MTPMRPLSLRHRITAGLLVYAAVLSAVLLGAVVVLNEHHERVVWRGLLSDVLERELKAAGWHDSAARSDERTVA